MLFCECVGRGSSVVWRDSSSLFIAEINSSAVKCVGLT